MYRLSSRLYKWTRTTTGSELRVAKARKRKRGGGVEIECIVPVYRGGAFTRHSQKI